MTALETILDHLIPERSSRLIDKTKFTPVKESLLEALDETDLETSAKEILSSNIRGINRAPLSKKLMAAIEKYDLPTETYNAELIKCLNKQRNSITHRGEALDEGSLWECLLLARELIVRVVLSELHYGGQYEYYVDGYKQQAMS